MNTAIQGCSRTGCTNVAVVKPIICYSSVSPYLYVSGRRVVGDLHLNLCVCEDHMSFDPSMFLTDTGKEQIRDSLRKRGLSGVRKGFFYVVYHPLVNH